MKSLIGSVFRIFGERKFAFILPLIVVAILAPGFNAGLMVDDHVHKAVVTQHPDLPELHRPASMLFTFVDGSPDSVEELVDGGLWPWWTAPELRLAFLRPIAGWTHAFDYLAWPDSPGLMHLHSAAWYALASVLLLGLYRRILPLPVLAGLAALLYSIDDSQTFPSLWLANRNTVVSLAFGVAALWAHDCWRRDGWRPGAVLSPILLILALLGNEGAVSIGGYLLGYALFLDPAPKSQRWLSLFPCTAVGLGWAAAYKIGQFGAAGSGIYIDPASEPLRFLTAAIDRAPILLAGWWGFPPSDVADFIPEDIRWIFWSFSLILTAGVAFLLLPVLRSFAVARFLALGMLLALVPACSTFPSNRLLAFVGIGAAGLLAVLLQHLWVKARDSAGWGRWGRGALVAGLLLVHLVLPPLIIAPNLEQMQRLETLLQTTAASIPSSQLPGELPPEDRELVVVATPSAFTALGAGVIHALGEAPRPKRTRVLSSGIYGTEVERPDLHTLVIRPAGGLLRGHGEPVPKELRDIAVTFDPRRVFLLLDSMFRDLARDPFEPGDRLDLDGVEIEILDAAEGRPLEVSFRFSEPLESPRWRWVVWNKGVYESFVLPAVGGRVRLPGLY